MTGLLCRTAPRRQAVGGAGLDDTPRGCERAGGFCCASATSRADRVASCLCDLPLLICAQCARGGASRCRSCEQNANDNCSTKLPPFPPSYDSHWMCKTSSARRWCSGCRRWPRGSTGTPAMNKITAEHLARRSWVYICQATPDQVGYKLASKGRQYVLS